MVCIPCILAPIGLFIWYWFIQPLIQPLLDKWWPSEKKLTVDCSDGVCKLKFKPKSETTKTDDKNETNLNADDKDGEQCLTEKKEL